MRTRTHGSALLAGLVGAVAVLGGCSASGQGGAEPTPTGGTVVSSEPSGGPVRPPLSPPSRTSPGASPSGSPVGEVTLRGVVEEGVEANCMVFKADGGGAYELIGVPGDLLRPGNRLEVTGAAATDMVSICMQGELFRVSSVKRI